MAKHILQTTIEQRDDNENTVYRRQNTLLDEAPTVAEGRSSVLLDTSETTINLPIAQVRQCLIRNTHASAKITVKWTPNGGAKVTVLVLGPGDGICFWHENDNASYGIELLTLTSDTSNATYEMFLGG